jgi:GNAT superfamily N-acetyltransferase
VTDVPLEYVWRGEITDDELVSLTNSYGGNAQAGWWDRVRPFSLGWVTGRLPRGEAVAFVNVAWDGGDHAFLVDTKVRADLQRRGIGTALVRIAVEHARQAGCEWLHVDYEDRDRLGPFYVDACGFEPIAAAVVHLDDHV